MSDVDAMIRGDDQPTGDGTDLGAPTGEAPLVVDVDQIPEAEGGLEGCGQPIHP
jgi:hypothetical protein